MGCQLCDQADPKEGYQNCEDTQKRNFCESLIASEPGEGRANCFERKAEGGGSADEAR